jgi:hypothetical protein
MRHSFLEINVEIAILVLKKVGVRKKIQTLKGGGRSLK